MASPFKMFFFINGLLYFYNLFVYHYGARASVLSTLHREPTKNADRTKKCG